jgi:hypothetical protein
VNKAEQEIVTGSVPLPDVQIVFLDQKWDDYEYPEYIEQKYPPADDYVISQKFAVPEDLSQEILERAINTLLLYHDGLRSRIEKLDDKWVQYIVPPGEATPLTWMDLSDLSLEERQETIKTTLLRAHHSLSLKDGPVIKCVYIKQGGEEPGLLVLVTSHIVADGISAQLVEEDLATLLRQLLRGQEPLLPPKSTSIKAWGERVEACLHAEEWEEQVQRLIAYKRSWSPPDLNILPLDYPDGKNDEKPSTHLDISLSQQETAALFKQLGKAWKVRLLDLLQTALVKTIAPWAGISAVPICTVVHGRDQIFEDIDLSRTLGCFTMGVLEVLELRDKPHLSPLADPSLLFAQILLNFSRSLEMAYESDGSEKYVSFYDRYNPQISLNVQRQREQSLEPGQKELLQPLPHGFFPFLDTWVATKTLDWFVPLGPDQLKLSVVFSPRYFKYSTVERLAQTFLRELRMFIKPE